MKLHNGCYASVTLPIAASVLGCGKMRGVV